MSFAGALFALTAAQAVSQISQGYAQKAESNYNASVFDAKADLIGAQQEIDNARYQRAGGQYMGRAVSVAAKQGVGLQGSVLAVMRRAQTQIMIDQSISNFNYEQDKRYAKASAESLRREGKAQVNRGYTNAFSTLLSGASDYALYNYKPKNTSFDYSTKLPRGRE